MYPKTSFEAWSATSPARAVARMIQTELPKILDLIAKARNPAQYARSFLEDQIKTKYLTNTYVCDDVTIVVSQQDFRKSLFARDANIKIEIDYNDFGQFKVSGIYFKYRDGGLPEPMFDRATRKGPIWQNSRASNSRSSAI